MQRPPFLKKGDRIGLAAPARKIAPRELETALRLIRDRGFEPYYEEDLFAVENQFAGSDKLRAALLQRLLDNPQVAAVFFARGGYGSVRIIDRLDFSRFRQQPKWLVGYSDVTVFHSHLNRVEKTQTLHASMPLNFTENSPQALDSLFGTLTGNLPAYRFGGHPLNRSGEATATLTGGNLSVLYSLLGSVSFPDTDGKILFLEDLDEYLYHIDRMMQGLKRAGKLDRLAGLVVGGMTEMNDNTVPFGKTAEEIIRETVEEFDYPVAFGFPAGHRPDNRALVMGAQARFEAGKSGSRLEFL